MGSLEPPIADFGPSKQQNLTCVQTTTNTILHVHQHLFEAFYTCWAFQQYRFAAAQFPLMPVHTSIIWWDRSRAEISK